MLLLSCFFVCSWNEHRVVNVPNTPQIFNIIWNYLRVDDSVLPNNTAVDCIQNMNSNFTSTDYKTFDEFSIEALIFVAHNNFERWKMMHARFALIRALSITTDSLLFMTHNLHIYFSIWHTNCTPFSDEILQQQFPAQFCMKNLDEYQFKRAKSEKILRRSAF